MPTVIDSLIVKLGLDAGDLTSKTPDVARKLKLVDDASKKNTDGLKKVTAASKETGTGFASLALSAGKFLAVLGGTVAIKNFIVDSVTANTALERMSQNLNIGVTSLSAWGSAARGLGGSAQGILSTFQMLSAARYQLFHGTGEMPAVGRYFTQIGLAPGELNAPHEQQMLDIQKYSLNRFGAGGKYTDSQRETAYQAGLAGGLSPDMMNLILMPGQQLKDYLKTMKGLAPSDKQAMEQTQLLKSMVMIGLDYRKLGYDLLELLNPVAEAANRFLVWVNKQTPAERDTILGGAGILGTLGAWLAGSWFAKKIGKAVGTGIGGGAATGAGEQVVERAAAKTVAENAAEIAAANAAEAGGVGAVVAGAGAAEVGTGGLATPIIIGAVIAVLAGLGIWWLIDKVKKDGWSGSGDSAAWQETKDFWSSVGSGIATAAKAVGHGTEAAGKWVANLTGDAFTKAAEGLRHFAYPDAGKMAIGYGHQILPGENFAGGVTTAQADALYKSDMGKAQATVAKLTAGLKLSTGQLGALADYQFNTGALANSHILALIRAGKYDEAAKAFETSRVTSRGVYNPGLFSRRRGEERMFLNGIPGAFSAAAYTPSSQTSSRSVTTNIGEVHVHTTASDAHGIAKDMKSSLDYRFAVQAQAGLG